MPRAAAISTHPDADEAASEVLRENGTALAAALAGFFAAAGSEPGVLLSPLVLLVAGGGAGARVFDGRCRQPGLGAKRPRGYTEFESIPRAAYAPVPASVAAAVVACAYGSGTTLGAAVRRGISVARRAGAPKRAALLERVLALGANVLGDQRLKNALLGDWGPAQGGLVGPSDLFPPQQIDLPAREQEGRWIVPWEEGDVALEAARPAFKDDAHALCAVDVRGSFVAVAFRNCREGLELPDYEVTLPPVAVPVRRGVARVAPGAPLPASASLAIHRSSVGYPVEVVASPKTDQLDPPEFCLRRDPETLQVSKLRIG